MRILVLGGDGYLGWPTALHLSARGLKPTLLSATLIDHLFDVVGRYKDRVDPAAITASVRWTETANELPRTAHALAQT